MRSGGRAAPARTPRSSSPAARSRSAARRSPPPIPRRGSSTTAPRTRCCAELDDARRCRATRRRRRALLDSRAADAVGRRDRRDRRRPGVGRADPGLRQGPGRLLVLLHLLHHPGRARPGAEPLPGDRPARTSGARSRAGHREIVLTGINIGTYDGGWSERGFRGSHTALRADAGRARPAAPRRDAVERIRLSSIEPQHVDDELLRVWADGAPRTLPHVHLPLQSGDDGVLRRMGRRYVSADYAAVVERVRAALPGVAIHGDAIVGFPTEDDAAWQRSLRSSGRSASPGSTCSATRLDRARPATRMAGQVDEPTKKRRAAELLAVAADARARWAREPCRAEADVLFEARLDDGRWVGHAADHTLVAVAAGGRPGRSLENAIGRVRVEAVDPQRRDRVIGRILSLSPHPGARVHARWPLQPDCLFCRIVARRVPATNVPDDDLVARLPRHRAAQPDPHPRHPEGPHPIGRRPDRRRMARCSAGCSRRSPRSRATPGIADDGYRIVSNVGRWGGQTVDHLHLHLMGGRSFE